MNQRERVTVSVDALWLAEAKRVLNLESDEKAVDRAVARVVGRAGLEALREHGPVEFFEDEAPEPDLAVSDPGDGRS